MLTISLPLVSNRDVVPVLRQFRYDSTTERRITVVSFLKGAIPLSLL
jgi:hypothetical protein